MTREYSWVTVRRESFSPYIENEQGGPFAVHFVDVSCFQRKDPSLVRRHEDLTWSIIVFRWKTADTTTGFSTDLPERPDNRHLWTFASLLQRRQRGSPRFVLVGHLKLLGMVTRLPVCFSLSRSARNDSRVVEITSYFSQRLLISRLQWHNWWFVASARWSEIILTKCRNSRFTHSNYKFIVT